MDIPMIPHRLEDIGSHRLKRRFIFHDIPMYSKLKWIFWFLSL